MKKLMITIAAVSSVAYMAKADLLTGTSFERLDAGTAGSALIGPDVKGGDGATYWAAAENADISQTIVTAYGEGAQYAGEVGRPDLFVTDPDNNKFLKVDTTGRLTRNIDVNGTGDAVAQNLATAPVFFDSLVQFTAAEDAPEVSSGDKLVVWLQGTDGENAATNLVITAGFLDENDGDAVRHDYVITGIDVTQNDWYRLTIKAIGPIGDGRTYAGFAVYVNGVLVTIDDEGGIGATSLAGNLTEEAATLLAANGLFPSLLTYQSAEATTLTSVSFEGTGAIDDLSFTTTTPAFLVEPVVETFDVAVSVVDLDAMVSSVAFAVDGGAAALVADTIAVPEEATTVQFVVMIGEGYGLSNAGAQKGAYDDESGDYTWTLDVAVSTFAKDGTDAITLTVVAEGGGDTGDFPAEWNSGDAVSDAIKTKFADWVEAGNDPTVTGAETAFLLGVEATGTEPELTAKIEIVDGKVVVTTEPALDNANGQVLLYKAATLEGLKIATPVEYTDGVTTDDDAGEAGFYKVTVGYPTAD